MSKNRNRNRSAKRSSSNPMPEGAMRKDARTYVQYIRQMTRTLNLPADVREAMDYDECRISHRIDASLRLLEGFKAAAAEIGFELNDYSRKGWLQLCVGVVPSVDLAERDSGITLAAAIWILDRLTECGRIEDACRLFPDDPAIYEEPDFPDVRDLCHPEPLLRGMHWIIRHRNDDCVGLKRSGASDLVRPLVDDYTASGRQHQNVPSRDRFTRIMAMLPQTEIDDVVDMYQDTYHDMLIRMLRSLKIYYARQDELLAAQKLVDESGLAVIRQAYDAGKEAQRVLSSAIEGNGVCDQLEVSPFDLYDQKLVSRSLYEQQNELEDELEMLGNMINRLTGRINVYTTMSDAERIDTFGAEVSAIWEDFGIHHPYELAFAYLYLLDHDSDLPWIYGVTNNLMVLCGRALPWQEPHGTPVVEGEVQYTDGEPFNEKTFSLYGTYFTDQFDLSEKEMHKCNFPQLIYRRTGYIIPRCSYDVEKTIQWIDRFGLRNTTLATLYVNMVGLLSAHANRTHMPAPADKEPVETIDPEKLLRQIHELEAAQKALRQEAYEATREAKLLKQKLDAVQAEKNAEHQELSDLRELLFTMDDAEPETSCDSTMTFPQHTNKRIVVFGGNPNWYHAMREKLPDVRFFRHETKPNPQMIQGADEIWIQHRAMSHKLYKAVINHATGHPVKIRYFHHPGATKCAEELIMRNWNHA